MGKATAAEIRAAEADGHRLRLLLTQLDPGETEPDLMPGAEWYHEVEAG